MRFKPNEIQTEMLTALGSSYHFDTLAGSGPPAQIRCTIVDSKLQTPYASGTGVTEEAAFVEAIKNAHSADKPQTAAEIAAERDKLKAELEALKSGSAERVLPKIINKGGRPRKNPLPVAPVPAAAVT